MLLAVSAIKNGELSSVREAARKYAVPSTTLRNRLNGVTCRSQKRANCHKLISEEEDFLVQWIQSSVERHATPPSRSHIKEVANTLLANHGTTPVQTVGGSWVYNFIKRRAELQSIYARRRYSRRIYNSIIAGKPSAETGSLSANPDAVKGQPSNLQNLLSPPGSQSTHLEAESFQSFKQLEQQVSKFKKLVRADAQSPSTQAVINKLIKRCEMILESGYSLLKEARDLRAALAERR